MATVGRERGSGACGHGSSGVALVLALLLAACGGSNGPATGDPGPDVVGDVPADLPGDTSPDILPDLPGDPGSEVLPDLPGDLLADVPPDVPAPSDPPYVAPDDRLRARYAARDLPVPLGISTAGYGQVPAGNAPRSPFADGFQATTTLLHPPRIQAVQVLRGDRRLLMVVGDIVAVFRTLETRVVERVRDRTGVDVSGVMVLAGNHTHTGPARLFDTPLGPIFSDSYREEAFEPVAEAVADAIVDVLSGENVPVKLGDADLQNSTMHAYRRCPWEAETQDDAMHLLRLERLEPPGTMAVILNYAMHGTVFGYADGVLGGDAPRSVELKVQEVLDGAPPVMFFQSWAGDQAPTDPRDAYPTTPWPESSPPVLDRLEALGRSAAETVLAGWDAMNWQEAPDLVVASAVAPMTWEAIGYAPGEWDHPAGALLCGGGGSVCTSTPPSMEACVDVDYGWIPDTVRLTSFRLGTVAGVTLPGEPATPLAQDLLDRVRMKVRPAWSALLFGYANGYSGYLLLPDDWARGGYEPGMQLFGPRQGEYLRDAAASVAGRLSNPDAPLSFTPAVPPAWAPGASVPYTPSASVDPGAIVTDLPASSMPGDVLTFAWKGGDPWVDRPEVVVEVPAAGPTAEETFEPLRAGGRVVDQRDYRVLLSVAPDPPWDQPAPGGRTFAWTATVRTALRIPAPLPFLEGRLRVSVTGRAAATGGTVAPYEAVSSPVNVTLPD